MVKPGLSRAWVVWGVAALFYLYEMVLRVSPSVMTNELMVSFNATSTMLGVIVSFYYYSYTLLQVPCGLILDKLGPRNLIGLSAILCVVGSALFAIAQHVFIAAIGRFLIGAGSACAFISCLQIVSQMFPINYFPILAGITNMMGTLGSLFGGVPVAKAVTSIGWQETIYCLLAIGVLIVALIFISIPKNIYTKAVKNIPITTAIRNMAFNKQVILSGIVAGLMYLTISVFSELWATPFFAAKYNITSETAAIASSVLFIGFAIGGIITAYIARILKSYIKTIKIGIFASACLFFPLIFTDISMYTSFIIVLLLGLFTGAEVLCFTSSKNNTNNDVSGTTIAFTNALIMLIGSIFQPLFGMILDLFWNGRISDAGIRIYEASCYKYAIATLPICLIVAYVLSIFMKETIHTEK
ncbi:MAG: MFS transporter [Holosporales bacterium]|jgi:MFS family permease|nr:MFS transporter [Holosporales bacterium]